MSGYLKRLVASAREPARAIHPIVGSLYSAPEPGALSATFQTQDDFVSVPSQPVDQPPAAATLLPPRGTEAESSQPGAAPRWRPEVHPAEPLLAPRPETAFDQPAITYFRSQPAHTSAPEPRGIAEAGPAAQEALPETAQTGPRYYKPLFGEVPPLAAAPLEVQRAAPPQPAVRKIRPAPHGNPQPAARQHDEIEIHIGRIEVTAVQQTVARPAAPPARKALNLDEYLKRGSRR